MISRELFLEIFPQEEREILEEIKIIKGAYSSLIIVGSYELFNDKKEHIGWRPKGANVYELVNICKQWASELGIGLASWVEQGQDGACELVDKSKNIKKMFSSDSESNAVFKACQWILDNK